MDNENPHRRLLIWGAALKNDPRAKAHVDAQARFTTNQRLDTRPKTAANDLDRYLRESRLRFAVHRLSTIINVNPETWSVLVLCSGRGSEATELANLGFSNVTASDISGSAVADLTARDNRISGIVLNAQDTGLEPCSYDLVVVQDGLHHLPNPVGGFVEQLRLARRAALFLEPHDSFPGRIIGREWEVNDQAVNYVFRWSTRLVDQVASSYFGSPDFINASYAYWHHNLIMSKLLKPLGNAASVKTAKIGKRLADSLIGRHGNQFCGLVIPPVSQESPNASFHHPPSPRERGRKAVRSI